MTSSLSARQQIEPTEAGRGERDIETETDTETETERERANEIEAQRETRTEIRRETGRVCERDRVVQERKIDREKKHHWPHFQTRSTIRRANGCTKCSTV